MLVSCTEYSENGTIYLENTDWNSFKLRETCDFHGNDLKPNSEIVHFHLKKKVENPGKILRAPLWKLWVLSQRIFTKITTVERHSMDCYIILPKSATNCGNTRRKLVHPQVKYDYSWTAFHENCVRFTKKIQKSFTELYKNVTDF